MFPLIIASSIAAISSSSWVLIWIFIEINSLRLCSILSKDLKKERSYSHPVLTYLVIQLSASVILLICVNFTSLSRLPLLFCVCRILLKRGVWPLHLWYLKTLQPLKIKTQRIKIIITWQKLLPMLILFYFPWKIILIAAAAFSIITPLKKLKKASSIKSILILSSLNNNGWFLISILCSPFIFFIYFIIYSSSLVVSLNFLRNLKAKLTLLRKAFYDAIILVGNIGRIPPSVIFLGKISVIYCLLTVSIPKIFLVLIITISCVFCYHYLWGVLSLLINLPSKTQLSFEEKSLTGTIIIFLSILCLWVLCLG